MKGEHITIPADQIPSNIPPTQKDKDKVFDEIAGYGGIFAEMVEAMRDNRNPLQEFHNNQEKNNE